MGVKCKVAIVGAGNMALEHIKAFQGLPNVELVGIYSRTKAKAQKLADEYQIPLNADGLDDLYNQTKANLVIVTVYETSMLEVAKSALQYPWTVFLEKPPGYNLKQAQEINNSAAGRSVIVGLNRRFLSSTRAVHESIAQVEGNRFITVFDQQSLVLAKSIGHSEEVVTHWMYANSIHLVDYISFFARGDVVNIKCDHEWVPEKPMVINASIEFSSGDNALYQGVWELPGPWAVNVITQDIRWEMRPLEKAVYQLSTERQLHPVDQSSYDQEYKPGFKLQAEEAVKLALGEKSLSPTLNDAIKTMKIINTIYKR